MERERVAQRAIGWQMIFCSPSPAIRRMLLVGVGTSIAQQFVGIDAILYYVLDVLERSGIESEKNRLGVLVLLGLLKLAFIQVSAKLFDRRGRRPLLCTSLAGKLAIFCPAKNIG